MFILLFMFALISEFFHKPSTEGINYLKHFLTALITFYLTLLCSEKNRIKKLLTALISGAVICILAGLFKTLVLDAKDTFSLVNSDTKRLITSMGHPNFLGSFLMLVFPISLNIAHFFVLPKYMPFRFGAKQNIPGDMEFKVKKAQRFHKTFKILLWFIINGIILSGIILSYSRNAWAGLLLGLILFIIIKMKIDFYKILIAFLILLSLTLFSNEKLPQKNLQSPVLKRLLSFTDLKSDNNLIERIYAFNAGLKILKKHSLYGIGPGNHRFQEEFSKYRHPSSKIIMPHPHNMILHVAVSFGLPGMFLFLIMFFSSFIKAITVISNKDPFSANISISIICSLSALVIYGMFDSPLFTPRLSPVIFFLMAIPFSSGLKK